MQNKYILKEDIKMAAVIAADKCVGCGACAELCPMEAITVEDVAVVDADKCVSCGACTSSCPNDAIEVE